MILKSLFLNNCYLTKNMLDILEKGPDVLEVSRSYSFVNGQEFARALIDGTYIRLDEDLVIDRTLEPKDRIQDVLDFMDALLNRLGFSQSPDRPERDTREVFKSGTIFELVSADVNYPHICLGGFFSADGEPADPYNGNSMVSLMWGQVNWPMKISVLTRVVDED